MPWVVRCVFKEDKTQKIVLEKMCVCVCVFSIRGNINTNTCWHIGAMAHEMLILMFQRSVLLGRLPSW
jgi:hypothetical protein